MRVRVTGDVDFETGQQILDCVDNRRGNMYAVMSQDVRESIVKNADASYTGSEALQMAVDSASDWIHSDGQHRLDITSLTFANYRQYGCGGLPITILVDITDQDADQMVMHMLEAIGGSLT